MREPSQCSQPVPSASCSPDYGGREGEEDEEEGERRGRERREREEREGERCGRGRMRKKGEREG